MLPERWIVPSDGHRIPSELHHPEHLVRAVRRGEQNVQLGKVEQLQGFDRVVENAYECASLIEDQQAAGESIFADIAQREGDAIACGHNSLLALTSDPVGSSALGHQPATALRSAGHADVQNVLIIDIRKFAQHRIGKPTLQNGPVDHQIERNIGPIGVRCPDDEVMIDPRRPTWSGSTRMNGTNP